LKDELIWSKDGYVATNSCVSVSKLKNEKFEDVAIETQDCEKKLPFICEVK
jgi:hypothetical protein